MVDDVQVLYYDGNNKKSDSGLQQNSVGRDDDSVHESFQFVAELSYTIMKTRLHQIKSLNNHTEGVHVYQRLAGCELDNNKESPAMMWDAYDGMEAKSYNMQNYTFNPLWPVFTLSRGQLDALLMEYINIYQPICIRALKHYLNKVKNVVLRKEPGDGPNTAVMTTVAVVIVLGLIFGILAFVVYKRRCKGPQISLKTVYTAAADSHSLWVFSTLIHGETQFPEFSMVFMVDDVQILYYDDKIKKLISRLPQDSKDSDDDVIHGDFTFKAVRDYITMKQRLHQIHPLSNPTRGVHVYQKLTRCELDNDRERPVTQWNAYDGTETEICSLKNFTINPQWPVLMLNKRQMDSISMYFMDVLQPICIQTLKHYLKKEKNAVLRKERPRVRLLHKTHTETGEVKLSCLATGFYPRHINLTMLRDGHPIPEEELILGALLPNGDGTYQLRRTLSVGAEELRERHHYTCSVTHLTLDNKLDIGWEPEDGPNTAIIIGVVVVV
ncbi:hypothetical protein JZ751_003267, partial [Albula glossodonta]